VSSKFRSRCGTRIIYGGRAVRFGFSGCAGCRRESGRTYDAAAAEVLFVLPHGLDVALEEMVVGGEIKARGRLHVLVVAPEVLHC
jgi:hypothetical protein